MDSELWDTLCENKGNVNSLMQMIKEREDKLRDIIEKHNSATNIIKYQNNLCTLRLCIKRDNLGVPIELWNIICGFVSNDIEKHQPYKHYDCYCTFECKDVYIKSATHPSYCPNDGYHLRVFRCADYPRLFGPSGSQYIKI